jgi:hypothetical protein
LSLLHKCTRLPDFSWCNIPKRKNIHQITTNY